MKTVLVVDDEPFVADVVSMALEDAGFRVLSASNGMEGLVRLAESVPDLIITDHMMPMMDGPAMVEVIRANPDYDVVPIILMSAVPYPSLRERCPGASYFLQKPFGLDEVVRIVGNALAERRTP